MEPGPNIQAYLDRSGLPHIFLFPMPNNKIGNLRLSTNKVCTLLKHINPNIEILSEYRGSRVPLRCLCLVCGNKWQTIWSYLKAGNGCPPCAIKRTSATRRLSTSNVKGRLKIINPSIKIMGEYTGFLDSLACMCRACKYTWKSSWRLLSQDYGCPNCAWVNTANKKKLSIEEIEDRLVDRNIKILTKKYKGITSPLLCVCSACKLKWKASGNSLSRGSGCPRCAKRGWVMSASEATCKLKQLNPNIKLLEIYKNSQSRIKCECLVCGHVWKWNPKGVFSCPNCTLENKKLSLHEIRRNLKQINPHIKILGPYKNSASPLRCECLKCGYKWRPTWVSLKSGHKCPKCGPRWITEEKARKTIERLTGRKFPKVKLRVNGKMPLELDGYNKRTKTGFEYNSEYHYLPIKGEKSLKSTKRNDERKRVLCYQRGIMLIRIPYWKKNDMKDFIKKKLSQSYF